MTEAAEPLGYPDREDYRLLIQDLRSFAVLEDFTLFRTFYDRLEGLSKKELSLAVKQIEGALHVALSLARVTG